MRRHAQLLPAIVPARASAGRKMKPILFVLALLTPAFAAGLTPYGLETEARVTPVGIDVPRPRLSWKLESPDREQKQTAYRVLAATSAEKLAQGEADLWDSGRVASEETAWIAFAGAPLHSFQGVWWRVRVWDVAGTASAWSAPAEFTMAVTDPKDWHASWIAYPESKLSSGPLPIFRKEVSLSATPTRALVFISGLGFHELRINGAKVGDHVLAPAWTNYRDSRPLRGPRRHALCSRPGPTRWGCCWATASTTWRAGGMPSSPVPSASRGCSCSCTWNSPAAPARDSGNRTVPGERTTGR
jgi:hypothetical protein